MVYCFYCCWRQWHLAPDIVESPLPMPVCLRAMKVRWTRLGWWHVLPSMLIDLDLTSHVRHGIFFQGKTESVQQWVDKPLASQATTGPSGLLLLWKTSGFGCLCKFCLDKLFIRHFNPTTSQRASGCQGLWLLGNRDHIDICTIQCLVVPTLNTLEKMGGLVLGFLGKQAVGFA